MSARNSVVWKEGLFIKPQHFQQEARAMVHHANARFDSMSPHLCGFSMLELNAEYLAFGKIAIVRARGVLPDGSVFDIPTDHPPPPPLAIADASVVGQVVHLTLPMRSASTMEVQWPQTYAQARYVAHASEVRDVHSPEGDYVVMDVAVPNLRVALEREDLSAFTTLAMSRIREVRPDGSIELDDRFYPTSVSLQAIPRLQRFLGEAAGLMRERARSIAERIASPAQTGVADVTDFNLLQALNRWQPYFQHLTRLRDVHPETLYIAFSQACGELVTFTDDNRLPHELPAYQHDRLQESFEALEDALRKALSTVLQPRAVPLPVVRQAYGVLTALVADRHLLAGAVFVLAVRARLPPDQLRTQFAQQAKITSLEKLQELVRLQLPGIPLVPLPVAPRQLPYHAGFCYFELDRTHPGFEFLHQDSAGFGFHIAGEFPELEMQFWAIRSA